MGYKDTEKNLCDAMSFPSVSQQQTDDRAVPKPFSFASAATLPPHDEEHLSSFSSLDEKPWRMVMTRTVNFNTENEKESTENFDDTEQESDSKQTPKASGKPKVSFSHVQVREYALIVGDHPYCSDWLPLSLGWKYNQHETSYGIDEYCVVGKDNTTDEVDDDDDMSIDAYFSFRAFNESPRRLGLLERRQRLKEVSGYTESQLCRIQQERFRSYQQEYFLEMDTGNYKEGKENREEIEDFVRMEL